MLEVNKKQAKFLEKAFEEWQADNLLSEEQVEQLQNNILLQTFDWQKLAKYCFVLAILCVAGAILSMLSDNYLLELLFEIIGSEWGAVITSSFIAAGFIYWGGRQTRRTDNRKLSSEALLAVGGIFIGVAIAFFGNAISTGSGHFSLLLLLAAFVYAPLAVYYCSIALWVCLLFSSTVWFGSELGYWAGFADTVLGLSYFTWYLVWGGVLVGIAQLLEKQERLEEFAPFTYTWGLLILFFNLWLLSFNFLYWDDEHYWMSWVWTLVLTLASFASLIWGIRKEDVALKAFGLGFFLLNIYTKYVQYFWEELHSTIFFLLLALSFWLIGTRAEDIWSGRLWKSPDDLLDR